MELIPISTLYKISGYRDRRSVAKWLEQSLGIQLYKVGKIWSVFREEYEEAMRVRYPSKKEITTSQSSYAPKNETERKFLSELADLLSRKHEV